MKIFLLLLFLIFSFSLFASSLFVFDMDHPVYSEMDALYIIEGKTSASGIRPWTEKDVETYLSFVNPETEAGKILKERIYSYIGKNKKDFYATIGAYLNLGLGYHTNASDFTLKEDWFRGGEIDARLLGLELGVAWQENMAFFADVSAAVNEADSVTYDALSTHTADARYGSTFSTNIIYLMGNGLSTDFPTRAYVSLSLGPLRINIGRDRLSWGNGVMGNMMIADTQPWYDHISLTAQGADWFEYQMLFSFFEHSKNSYNWFRVPSTGLRFFLGHRMEFSLLSNSLKISLSESIMYQSKDNYFDARTLIPVYFMHNLYIGGNANSLITAELEWSPVKKLSFYAQGAIDEIVFITENSIYPNAWGVMVGVKTVLPLKENYFYGSLEIVYLNPYMYHRVRDNGENSEDDTYNYLRDLYYVSTIKVSKNGTDDDGIGVISRYLAFPFGSDTIAAALRFGYKDIDLFTIESNVFFMIHGDIDKWEEIGEYGVWDDSGIKEYSLVAGAEAEVNPLSYLSLTASLYFNLVWNKDNVSSPLTLDIQSAIGVKLKY